jgi:predicted acylesterase/phospholipase RssA/CRP-like cAMP-binding protein
MIASPILAEADREALLPWAEQREWHAGELLIQAGAPGDSLFVVLDGEVVVEHQTASASPAFTEHRGPGELAGILAFFSGCENPWNIRCHCNSRLARLSRATFDSLLEDNPDLWRKLEEIGLQHMRRRQLSQHLDRLFGPFGAMAPHILREIEEDLQWLPLNSGQTLFRQGDHSDGAYIVLTGRLQMETRLADGREGVYDTVLAGETIGEAALLTGRPQGHTVYAARDSELVRLSPASFELLLKRNTRAIYNVSRILGDRLARAPLARDPARTPIRCIALIPAGPQVRLQEFARFLEVSVREHGATLHLSSDLVGRKLQSATIANAGENEAAGLRLTQWLSEQEDQWRFLLYEGDAQWSAWSERCVRQADEVVVVADTDADSDLAAVVARLARVRQRWSLALWHAADLRRPRGTETWLKGNDAHSVFHLRAGQRTHFERLGRILTGNAISLVLGGGGARGFAHLGVLRAMEELNIPIDMVGGTSMGAPIAGLVAQGCDAGEVASRSRSAHRKIIDYTLPIASLISGKRISTSIQNETGDWDIEDFWLPFFCVSANLTTGQPVVHRRGSSWRAIRTSVSIPGVLPPMPSAGDLLVDGAVLNNLPIDVMRDLNPFGSVIAVDVTPPTGPAAVADYGAGLSGWRLLTDKLLPWRSALPVPGMANTILQATTAGSTLKRQQMLDQSLADLYLNINVEGVGMLQFAAQDTAAAQGYTQALDPLREWLHQLKAGQTGGRH